MQGFKKASGMPVATIAEGTIIGKLDDLQFDLDSGEVYGFRLKQGLFGRTGGVPAEAVTRLGRDLVYVSAEGAVDWSGAPRVATPGRAWASEYRGTGVMSRRGAGLGEVEDFLLEAGPCRVVALVLDGSRVVAWDHRVRVGRDAVILDDPSVAVARPAEEEEVSWWARVRGRVDGG